MNKAVWLLALCMLSICTGCDPRYFDHSYPPEARRFLAVEEVSRTNPVRRQRRFIDCGIPAAQYDDDLTYVNTNLPGETDAQRIERKEKLVKCMFEKDYVVLTAAQCGQVRERRHICN